MKPNRKNTKKVLIDLCYGGSSNEFEEFYGYSVTYQELEQQSYIEFKQIMFENINNKIKFRKYGRIGPVLTLKAEMYDGEIEKFENLINNNKIQTIYGWIVKDVVLINDDKLELIDNENVEHSENSEDGEGNENDLDMVDYSLNDMETLNDLGGIDSAEEIKEVEDIDVENSSQ